MAVEDISNDTYAQCEEMVRHSCSIIQWSLYTPTLYGQEYCVRLQRLSDYGETLSILSYGDCTS